MDAQNSVPYLPADVVNEILENLANDEKSLHSALLSSRDWCRTAVPILWRNPFGLLLSPTQSPDENKARQLLKVYFSYVIGDDLTAVKTWNVRIPKYNRRSLTFDYISCLQTLNDRHIITFVNICFPSLMEGWAWPIGHNLVCYHLTKQMIRHAKNLIDISISSHHWSVLPTEQVENFFDTLTKRHQKIRSMIFRLRNFGSPDLCDHLTKYAECAVDSINRLKFLEEIEFCNIDIGFPEILKSLCWRPRSLRRIKFRYCCFYNGRHRLLNDWQDLENLEELNSIGCHHLVSADLSSIEDKMTIHEKKGLIVKLFGKGVQTKCAPEVENDGYIIPLKV